MFKFLGTLFEAWLNALYNSMGATASIVITVMFLSGLLYILKTRDIELGSLKIKGKKKKSATIPEGSYDWINETRTAALNVISGNIIHVYGEWIPGSEFDAGGMDLFSRSLQTAKNSVVVNFSDSNIPSKLLVLLIKAQETKKIRIIYAHRQEEYLDIVNVNNPYYPNLELIDIG